MPLGLFETEMQFIRLLKLINSTATTGRKLINTAKFLNNLLEQVGQEKYISYYIDLQPYLYNLIKNGQKFYLSPEIYDKLIFINKKLSELKQFSSESFQSKFSEIEDILKESEENLFKPVECELLTNSIPIVLIERCSNDTSNDEEYGLIQRFNLSSSVRSKNEKVNKVEFRNYHDSESTGINKYLDDIVTLAEDDCKNNKIDVHCYNLLFFFDSQEFIYSGKSFGVGAACLLYNSILINELYRYYYKFKNDCVFTGEIDREGNLIKLNRNILQTKLKTVFFSGYKKFIIPEDNIIEAKAELAELQKKFPERKLELIPINNFRGVFRNSDIVERFVLKFHQKLKANYDKYHKIFNTLLSVILFLFLIFFFKNFVKYLDRNPVSYNLEDSKYVLYNKHGVKLWKSEELEIINKMYFESPYGSSNRCILTDINSDGINELLYLNKSDIDIEKSQKIFCSNSEIINFPYKIPQRNLNYPNDPVTNSFMYLRGISLIDCDGDGKNDILYWALHTQTYPGLIGAIDYNGKEIAEFWNEGHPIIVRILDLNNDGKQKIFAGGCNNRDSIECAVLIVFDPEYISGSSPFSDPLSNGIPGKEEYYILFPKSVLFEQTTRERNDVYDINLNSNNTITCWTSEGQGVNDESLMYEFDKDMNLVSISCDDKFKHKYNILLQNNKKNLPDLNAYLESLKNKVRWWDGTKFVASPSKNRSYTEVKENSK